MGVSHFKLLDYRLSFISAINYIFISESFNMSNKMVVKHWLPLACSRQACLKETLLYLNDFPQDVMFITLFVPFLFKLVMIVADFQMSFTRAPDLSIK